jgi:hypothetical protein
MIALDRLSAFDHVFSVSMELALLILALMSGLRRASTNDGTVSTRLTSVWSSRMTIQPFGPSTGTACFMNSKAETARARVCLGLFDPSHGTYCV